jgi:asparaginyl-tRNA synthetase
VLKNRVMKKLVFCVLRDGTGICQGVINRAEIGDEQFELASSLNQEAAVELRGVVAADERAPGGFEMQVSSLKLLADSVDYPITPKEHGPEFLLDRRHLWLRSSKQHALMRLRHTVKRAINDFFHGEGFTQIDAPVFTPNACEGTTTLFETEYFGQTAYLTQSGQLYMEAAAAAVGKAYCFGPTFRAEKSKTRRHLTEFWMVEPEVAFADLDDAMSLAERFFEYVVHRAIEEHRDLLESVLERDVSKLEKVRAPFPRLAYTEAVRLLNEELDHPFEWGGDFGSPDETKLAEQFDSPFIVHRFPAAIKAFYMARDPEDERLSLSMDVLAPEGYGEIIGGGERSPERARSSGISCREKHSSGTSTCAATGPFPMRDSGSAWNGWSRTFPGSTICGKPSPSRARSTASIPDPGGGVCANVKEEACAARGPAGRRHYSW